MSTIFFLSPCLYLQSKLLTLGKEMRLTDTKSLDFMRSWRSHTLCPSALFPISGQGEGGGGGGVFPSTVLVQDHLQCMTVASGWVAESPVF